MTSNTCYYISRTRSRINLPRRKVMMHEKTNSKITFIEKLNFKGITTRVRPKSKFSKFIGCFQVMSNI